MTAIVFRSPLNVAHSNKSLAPNNTDARTFALYVRDMLVSHKDSFIADDDIGVRIPYCGADKAK